MYKSIPIHCAYLYMAHTHNTLQAAIESRVVADLEEAIAVAVEASLYLSLLPKPIPKPIPKPFT